MINELRVLTLRLRKERSSLAPVMVFHLSEIIAIGKNSQRETTDDEAIQYVKRSLQRLRETQWANSQEIAFLEELLPEMVTMNEVQEFLNSLDSDLNKGEILKAVRAKFGARVDMKIVANNL